MKRTFPWTLVLLCGMAVMTVAFLSEGRLWGQRTERDLLAAGETFFEFGLEIDGQTIGFFHKCTGLVSDSDVFEETVLTDAGLQMTEKKPGSRIVWENITLTRSVGASDISLWQWREQIEDGDWNDAIKNGSIVLYGPGGETARWAFTGGWPVRLSADESVEELTIAHNGLERVGEPTSRPSR